MKKYLPILLISIITLVFINLSFLSASRESLTFDEIVDLQEGRNAVLHHTFDIDPYNPPLTREISVLPYLFTKDFYTNPLFAQEHAMAGRSMMILLGVGLLLAVYFFTQKYCGTKEAFFAAFLLSLEPSLLAHSHYITMDIGLTLIFFLSYLVFMSWFKKYTLKKNIYLAILTGVGMVIKITFIPFFLLSTIVIAVIKRAKISRSIFFHGIMFIMTVLVVIWSVYFFNFHVVIKERRDSSRVSERLLSFAKVHHMSLLASVILFGKDQPVPMGDYLATLKNNAIRSTKGQTYFISDINQWYRMPYNLFLKIPLPLWIFSFSGIFLLWKKMRHGNDLLLFITIPLISIISVSFLFRMQPLVRYILPVYPFLIILGGVSWEFWQSNIAKKILFGGLVFWYITGTLGSFPHFLSYANEFAGYPQERYKVLMDSNLDWGQSLPDIKEYLSYHNIKTLHLSYFGQDNGNLYGLQSDKMYTSPKLPDICAFHRVTGSGQKEVTLISISNWYFCGYKQSAQFRESKIKGIIGDTLLLF